MLNLNINLKKRLENKTFWVGMVSAIILLAQQCGFDATTIIPKNYVDIINSIFAILAMLGITVDTSTTGISNQISTSNSTENAIEGTKESTIANGSSDSTVTTNT